MLNQFRSAIFEEQHSLRIQFKANVHPYAATAKGPSNERGGSSTRSENYKINPQKFDNGSAGC